MYIKEALGYYATSDNSVAACLNISEVHGEKVKWILWRQLLRASQRVSVASYGHWGMCPINFQRFNFL